MREAIFRAELGDDSAGRDPTVNRLQEIAAERMGKEAALLVASGTMGNLVCALTFCRRGERFIAGNESHMIVYEPGLREIAGLEPLPLPNMPDGTLDLDSLERVLAQRGGNDQSVKMLALENTHNRCGGAILAPRYIKDVARWAQRHGLALHLDGARLFNAAVALGTDVREFTRNVESVMFCLSKGLSCPVGSLVCGDREFVEEARRVRGMVGGSMRQAGIIAAAGIVALDQMVDRMREDHANAKCLAQRIRQSGGLRLAQEAVDTNVVRFELLDQSIDTKAFVRRLADLGLRVSTDPFPTMRAVTHYGIEHSDVVRAADIIGHTLEEFARA